MVLHPSRQKFPPTPALATSKEIAEAQSQAAEFKDAAALRG